MKSKLTTLSAALTLVTTGAMAGLYYAFSVAVMPGLDETDANQAIPAMRSINREIENPVFFLTFFGAPVAAILTGWLLRRLGRKRAGTLCFLAAAVYLLGSLAPTVIVNVPLNNDLDTTAIPSDPDEATRIWSDYSSRWTLWNSMRAAFTTLSLLLFALATYVWGREERQARKTAESFPVNADPIQASAAAFD